MPRHAEQLLGGGGKTCADTAGTLSSGCLRPVTVTAPRPWCWQVRAGWGNSAEPLLGGCHAQGITGPSSFEAASSPFVLPLASKPRIHPRTVLYYPPPQLCGCWCFITVYQYLNNGIINLRLIVSKRQKVWPFPAGLQQLGGP